MVEFKNLLHVAFYFKVDLDDVRAEYNKSLGWSYMRVNEHMLQQPNDDEVMLVYVDEDDNADCKEYIMKYEIKEYNYYMLVDGQIVEVEVEDFDNIGVDDITHITVAGIKYEASYECFKYQIEEEGIVYYIEKDDEEE